MDREKRTKMLVGAFIIAIMVLSAFGFILNYTSPGQALTYGDYTFKLKNGQYETKVDGRRVSFNLPPQYVEDINATPGIAATLQGPLLFVTYDPGSNFASDMAAAQLFLEEVLPALKGTTVIRGVTQTNSSLPVVTCANATGTVPVLSLAESNQSTQILLENNCIIAAARNGKDFVRLQDRILYLALGVMQ
ncbi:hypothetical protein HY642_04280 [Candidatus Woesearchaeota archaeon]|nr:hypothetical protein [Candidatus Woesearchaeota archaeon]